MKKELTVFANIKPGQRFEYGRAPGEIWIKVDPTSPLLSLHQSKDFMFPRELGVSTLTGKLEFFPFTLPVFKIED